MNGVKLTGYIENMNCSRLHKGIIFYIEGSLPEDKMQEVAAHLSECSKCRAFAGELEKILSIAGQDKLYDAKPYFFTRLKARLTASEDKAVQSGEKSIIKRILQPAFFSLLLLTGIYAGIDIGRQAGSKNYHSEVYAEDVFPWLNELNSEPLENFLME